MLELVAEFVLRLFAEAFFRGLFGFVGKLTVAAFTLRQGSCSDYCAVVLGGTVLLGGTVVFFGLFVAIVPASR